MAPNRKKSQSKRVKTTGGLIKLSYTPREIEHKTKMIYQKVITSSQNFSNGNFTSFGSADLKHLFQLYDHHFFNNYFTKNCGDRINFRLSERMTQSGGKTSYWKQTKTFEICLSTTLIFQTFKDVFREIQVNGIVCRDRLETVMRILEHEIIHLMELVACGKSSCSKPQFQQLSGSIFNHSGVTHQLVTHAERAYKKFNLKPGDQVAFDFEGRSYVGKIHRITKRATVLVRHCKGSFRDKQGRQYSKFYVPVFALRRQENME